MTAGKVDGLEYRLVSFDSWIRMDSDSIIL